MNKIAKIKSTSNDKNNQLCGYRNIAEYLGIPQSRVDEVIQKLKIKHVIAEFKYGCYYIIQLDVLDATLKKSGFKKLKISWEKKVKSNRKKAAKKAAKTRKTNAKLFKVMEQEKKNCLDNIAKFPKLEKAIFKTCYYLFHLNHYAKTKSINHWEKEDLYQIKNKFLFCIYKLKPPYLKINYINRQNCQDIDYRDVDDDYYDLHAFILDYKNIKFNFSSPVSISDYIKPKDLQKKADENLEFSEDGISHGRPIRLLEAKLNPIELVKREIINFIEQN